MSSKDQPVETDAEIGDANGNSEAAPASVSATRGSRDPAVSEFHAKKLKVRRERWAIDMRVAAITGIAAAVVIIFSAASYSYHSLTAASTFIDRADSAKAEGDLKNEVRWLSRYLMVRSDEPEILVRVAAAADQMAEEAAPDDRSSQTHAARKRLGNSIAQLGSRLPEERDELRRALIRRLLQLGGSWFREAESQVVLLQADSDDPAANKALALSLMGQVQLGIYDQRDSKLYDQEKDYWAWLANQKPGIVLMHAYETNPKDVDTSAAFLNLIRSDRDLFLVERGTDENQRLAADEHQRKLSEMVADCLTEMQILDHSRAQLAVFYYGSQGSQRDQQTARDLLYAAADKAMQRLSEYEADEAPESDEAESTLKSRARDIALGQQFSDQYWDYVCILEAARTAAGVIRDAASAGREKSLDRATAWYRFLIDQSIEDVSADLRKDTYLYAGILFQQRDDLDAAIATWKSGLAELNADNLDLLGILLIAQIGDLGSQDDVEASVWEQKIADAKEVLTKFRKAIDSRASEVIQMSTSDLTSADRSAIAREIEFARWRANFAEAEIELAGDSSSDTIAAAIRLYRSALESSAEIRPEERIVVATRLAEQYRRTAAWDQAAEVLSSACEMLPGNETLHANAAEAWERAGNEMKAIEHWRLAENSNILSIRIAAIEGAFNYQLRRPTEFQEKDFSGVRASLERLEREFNAAKDSFDPEQAAAASLSIRTLKLSLPPPSVAPGEHFSSQKFASEVFELANEHPDDARIQAYAAERLAAAGDYEHSDNALSRLIELEGPKATSVAIVRARIEAQKGDPKQAAEIALAAIADQPDQASRLAKLASVFARSASDEALAYQALLRIPETERSPKDYFEIYKQAKRVPGVDEAALADLLQKLKDREGAEEGLGSYWRFIELSDLIASLQREGSQVELNAQRLLDANSKLNKLLTLRPRWGEALALRGWISAISNRPDVAVEQLQFAISAGDQKMLTRQLLWSQLIKLGRDQEVNREIEKTSMAVGTEIDPYGQMTIRAAVNRNDMTAVVEAARTGIERRPLDPTAHLLFAKTATLAVRRIEKQSPSQLLDSAGRKKRQDLIDEARRAIEKATELSETISYVLLATRLELELGYGKTSDIDEVEQLIEKSKIGDRDRHLLVARLQIHRRELDAAIDSLLAADKLKPELSVRSLIAELMGRTNRYDEQIDLYYKMLAMSPDNVAIKERLANAIIQRDGENVDWDEIAKLLDTSEDSDTGNRLLYAMLLGARGDQKRQADALRILRELVREQNARSYNASILLAALLLRMHDNLDEGDEEQAAAREKYLEESRAIYERLSLRSDAAVDDLYRFGLFLAVRGDEEDLTSSQQIADRLKSMPDGVIRALQLGFAILEKSGDRESAPEWLNEWMASGGLGADGDNQLGIAAGTILLRLDFVEQGLEWFAKSYEKDPNLLTSYVIALTQAKKYAEAAEVAAGHFQEHGDARSAMLLLETLLATPNLTMADTYSEVLGKAIAAHPRDAALLESAATWAMQRGRVEEAIALYRQVLSVDSLRVRTLNNLAMAYSQSERLAPEGLEPINQAIKLAGSNPELLDTKGALLLRIGDLEEALVVFSEAAAIQDNPRFQFHRVLTLLGLGRVGEARNIWNNMNTEQLDRKGLTPDEQKTFDMMQKDFSSFIESNKQSS